jgi:hypothetical protein
MSNRRLYVVASPAERRRILKRCDRRWLVLIKDKAAIEYIIRLLRSDDASLTKRAEETLIELGGRSREEEIERLETIKQAIKAEQCDLVRQVYEASPECFQQNPNGTWRLREGARL